jgi:Domain of unknown function (DUF3597)
LPGIALQLVRLAADPSNKWLSDAVLPNVEWIGAVDNDTIALLLKEFSMGIFSSIMEKIFPKDHPAVAAAPQATPPSASLPSAGAAPVATAAPASMPAVDVEQVLANMAAKNPEKLNWRTSIVDLMKLLGLDSSLNARKELASELHYTGDMSDSASMNLWLQKQVMAKLAANGGKVPAELK